MATEAPAPFIKTFTAGANLSTGAQFRYVKLDGTGKVVLCSAATDIPIGVLQNNPASGGAAVVMIQGVTKLVANAAITLGAALGTASTAKATGLTFPTTSTYAAPTAYVVGRALSAASADGDVITALVDAGRPTRLA